MRCATWLMWLLLASTVLLLLVQNAQGFARASHDNDILSSQASDHWPHVIALEQSQRQIRTVLQAVSDGTAKLDSALHLLDELHELRSSLENNVHSDSGNCAAAPDSSPQEQPCVDASTQGILIVAGGSHQLRNAFILLSLLTHPDIDCKLPVELVYYGQQEYDAATANDILNLASQKGITVKLVDGSSVLPTGSIGLDTHKPPGKITGFKAKVHALVWVTTFDQVIMLDSDNTPLTDPTPLLQLPVFQQHGSIFWPDFWTNQWMQPALYSLLGLNTPWEVDPGFRACEAGQVVLDRARHWDVLQYLWLLNVHSNSGIPGAQQGFVGQCLWGDKDTYSIAFHLAGKAADFYSTPHTPLQALSQQGTRLRHAGMVHRAPWGSGPLMWLHRTAAGKFWPHCHLHGGASCKAWGFTTPVDQQQLLSTVADPSAMEMDVLQVDQQWAEQHCTQVQNSSTGDESAGGARDTSCDNGHAYSDSQTPAIDPTAASEAPSSPPEGPDDGDGHCALQATAGCGVSPALQPTWLSNATALPCDLDQSAGLLPIPVIRPQHMPAQVRRLLQAAADAFKASQPV